jgi:hypothetical protein
LLSNQLLFLYNTRASTGEVKDHGRKSGDS